MAEQAGAEPPELERAFWRLYREFFDLAERRRRWSLRDDIPWDKCSKNLDPAVADVVESFTAVELYLPDYASKILPMVRPCRSRTWFYANWAYEESKHSLALGDWLLKSGQRTEEQMADLENMAFEREWHLPHDSRLGMLVYAVVQELATWLSYRNLRRRAVEVGDDPALAKLLTLLAVDEMAHHDFLLECLQIHLKHDRDGTLEQMRRVMNNFAMPAIHELAQGQRRVAAVKEMNILTEDIYYREVYLPLIEKMGIDRTEMRNRVPVKKSLAT